MNDYDLEVEDGLKDIDNKIIKDNLKENVKKASDFLESCFDENNDDDLSFDERVQQRKHELTPEILEIVESAEVYSGSDDGLRKPIFTGENVSTIESLLNNTYKDKLDYKNKKRELKEEQAKIRMETDWSTAIPDRPRPNDEDKKAYITLKTLDLQKEVDELEVASQYSMDYFKLKKLLLQL